ncbi:MAG: MaoC family dehydratase [Alphaproteobacteria bacterium]|nr:MaoC family dehydratase [Alphaproteobacteria bacterium]
MSALDAFVPGERMDYGEHVFTAEEIIAFATKYDPQPFHIDPVAAKQSMFGALCASGWHTAAIWMKKNLEHRLVWDAQLQSTGRRLPNFGPSPGLRDMKWPTPVFVDDTIHFYNTITVARALRSKTGWGIVEMFSEGINQHDQTVISFDSAALFELG